MIGTFDTINPLNVTIKTYKIQGCNKSVAVSLWPNHNIKGKEAITNPVMGMGTPLNDLD